MSRRVGEMLHQIGEYVLTHPGVVVSPFDDGGRGEIGYRAQSVEHPAKWIFRFRDLQNFYSSGDPRAELVRTYMQTHAGRQQLPALLAEFAKPAEEEEPVVVGPPRCRFEIIEEMMDFDEEQGVIYSKAAKRVCDVFHDIILHMRQHPTSTVQVRNHPSYKGFVCDVKAGELSKSWEILMTDMYLFSGALPPNQAEALASIMASEDRTDKITAIIEATARNVRLEDKVDRAAQSAIGEPPPPPPPKNRFELLDDLD